LFVVALIGAELAFTTYVSVYGFANSIGHLFKIVSLFFLYRAIIVSGLMRPYGLLFRDLKQNEERLQQAHDELELRVQQRTAELAQANRELGRAIEEIKLQLERLRALREIDRAIIGSTDIYLSLRTILEQVTTQLCVDAAAVLLLNSYTQTLEYAAGSGFRSKIIERSKLRIGQGYAGRAALEQRLQHIPDLASAGHDFTRMPLIAGEDFVEYYAVPLIAKGNVNGVLEIFHRQPLVPDSNWLEFLHALAGQSTIAIDNSRLLSGLQRANLDLLLAYEETIEGWSRAMDIRDKETEGHTLRVTEMTLRLAKAMDMGDAELVHIRRGALLHDIGKMGVPDAILLKPGKLTDEEWKVMRAHPQMAVNLISPINYLHLALDIPYCHHERWDGTGYPRGLKGEQIPLAARIFAVVDVWDALRSDRPYRPAWPEEKILEHIRSLAGTHFDPKAVELFFQMSEQS
ncbi:MAG: HD domain-containing protein, partial [Chloroflexi bacterium]|nr:HD domain-containing protein [Chloroflexota bacterium]